MRTHLCLVAPDGYVHSQALIDPLLHFQHQFEAAGAEVTVAKNVLEKGAINFIFGAHIGFDSTQLDRFDCVIVNLEQVARNGAVLLPAYQELLRRAVTVDYHSDNAEAYQHRGLSTPVIRFGYAPYLAAPVAPLEERPIDVLFLGIVTERRAAVLSRVLASGVNVVAPPRYTYGQERDELVRQAKVVLNVSAYESTRFEQVRASVVLSCGTPMVTEARSWMHDDDAWAQPYLHHFHADSPGDFFTQYFGSSDFFAASRAKLEAWSELDVSGAYANALEILQARLGQNGTGDSRPGRPVRIQGNPVPH